MILRNFGQIRVSVATLKDSKQKSTSFQKCFKGMFFDVKYYLAAGTKVRIMFAVLPPNSIGDFNTICVLESSVNTKR